MASLISLLAQVVSFLDVLVRAVEAWQRMGAPWPW